VQLTRHSVLVIAIALGIASVALPSVLAWTWSWQRAEARERAELKQLADAAAYCGHAIVDQVRIAFDGLKPPSASRCSAADIAALRARTVDTRVIEEIGYQRDGQLLCNSWGEARRAISLSPSYAQAGGGLQLRTANFSPASPGTRLISVSGNGYYAYVEPGRFANIASSGHTRLTVSTAAGELIAERKPAGGGADWSFSVTHTDALLRIVVAVPMQRVAQAAARQRWTLLPLAALCSVAGLAGIAIWLRRRLSLAGELRVALKRRELQVHYQPIIDLASGHCVGAEALARWQHPSGRWIAADVFIAEAERHGLIQSLTVQVIQTVVKEMGPLLRRQAGLHISINLSAQDIDDDSARLALSALMALHGVAPNQIWLEMTERGFMNAERARATLGDLRTRAHQILIDDFGTGYSSLSYLQTLPLDGLKIDKSFVDRIDPGTGSSCVIDHIIEMARSLGLMLIAEGVETAQQARYLRERQVDFAQGWLFAKAMPAEQFQIFARAGAAPSMVGDPGQDQGKRG